MNGFPQLTTEDVEQLERLLNDFVTRSGVLAVLMVESAGYLIHRAGGEMPADPSEFASLASNAFSAAQAMSKRLKENFFTQLRVSGTTYQTLIRQVGDENCLLVVLFNADMDAKKIEDEAITPVIGLYELLKIARDRAPGVTVDFADADAEIATKFFRRTPPPA